MALHPLKLPPNAREFYRVVAMQKLLLKALCSTPMNAGLIDEKWLRSVWQTQEQNWVHNFCRKRQYSVLEPIKMIADATLNARCSLYEEFCRQSRARVVFNSGGQFHELSTLKDFTPTLAKEVKRLFARFYQFLSHETKCVWDGYEFPRGRRLNLENYKTYFDTANRPDMTVCPYCDGTNEGPDLDHYYAKESFPLLSCSPWNLVPACHSCNKLGAKANRLPMTLGTPKPTAKWLHPYFRPASKQIEIRLSGTPRESIPRLHSVDPAEQEMLSNHDQLIPTLSTRWTRTASIHFDNLVREVNRKIIAAPTATIDSLVIMKRNDHLAMRAREAFSMVHAAVCQAILDGRSEYLQEFKDPNQPSLD